MKNNLSLVSYKRDEYVTIRVCSIGFETVPVEYKLGFSHVDFVKRSVRFGTTESESGALNKTAWVTSQQFSLRQR